MINTLISSLAIAVAVVSSVSAAENNSQTYARIANELFQSLPKNARVAFQPVSESETKVPASIIRSIEVGLTSALQRESEFEIRLIARDRLQAIWQEARQFSSKPFEQMVAEAGAEVLLIGEYRPNSSGVEISYRAFRVAGSAVGSIIASSKPSLLAIDWQKELGAQPLQLADTMKEMADAMKRLSASGGLVGSPTTPAELYHNARVLAQRGEVDLAIENLEKVISQKLLFIDPIVDLLSLTNRLYGAEGTAAYVRTRLGKIADNELVLTAQILTGNTEYQPDIVQRVESQSVRFLPFYVEWLRKTQMKFTNKKIMRLRHDVAQKIKKEYDAGALQSFFIDQLRGAASVELANNTLAIFQGEFNRKTLMSTTSVYFEGRRGRSAMIQTAPRMPHILDAVNFDHPIIVCTSVDNLSSQECQDVRKIGKWQVGEQMTFPLGPATIPWADNHTCIQSVQYTDTLGFVMNEKPFVKFEDRLSIRSSDEVLDKIVECAGRYLDQPAPVRQAEAARQADDDRRLLAQRDKEALDEKNARLRAQTTSEDDFRDYIVKERLLKQFLGEDILLGNAVAKNRLPITYGGLAKIHLDLRDSVSTLSRVAFFEKYLLARNKLLEECRANLIFSKVKREVTDADGYCKPSNPKAAPALMESSAGSVMIFEKLSGLKFGSIDQAWNEPRVNQGVRRR